MNFVCQDGKERVQFTQRRFEPVNADLPASESGWRTPFCLRSDDSPDERFCDYATPGASFDLGACNEGTVWVPDAGGKAYARFHSTSRAPHALLEQIPNLSIAERLTVGSNTKALLDAGLATPDDLVASAEGLMAAGDRWSQSMAFGWSTDWLEDILSPDAQDVLTAWAAKRVGQIEPRYTTTTFRPDESEAEALHHRAVLRFLANVAQDKKTVEALKAHGKAWLTGGQSPDGQSRRVMSRPPFRTAEQDNKAAYPLLKEAIQSETDPSRRRTFFEDSPP